MNWFYISLYLAVCIMVAFYGRHTRLGLWGLLLVCFFFTPWLIGFGLVFLAPNNSNLLKPFTEKDDKLKPFSVKDDKSIT